MSKKIILTKIKQANLTLDLESLFKDNGRKRENYVTNLRMARLLDIISALLIVIPVLILILASDFTLDNIAFPKTIIQLLPYFSIYTILISLYLKRERDTFDDSLKTVNLKIITSKLLNNQVSEIEINKFLSHNLECLIEKAYFDKENNFILNLVYLLSNNPNIRNLWERRLGLNIEKFLNALTIYKGNEKFSFEHSYKNLFIYLFDEALKLEFSRIDEFILLLVLNKYFLKEVLLDFGVSDLEIEGLRIWFKNEHRKNEYFKTWKKLSKLKPTGDINRSYTSKATPTLDLYSVDFTKDAAKGNFTLSVGRDEEIKQVLNLLEKDTSSSILLLGEPGVGKTRFLRYLATRMAVEDVPASLHDGRLVVVDLNKVLTQSATVENFKMTIQRMFDEVKSSKDIVLVLEEFSQIMTIREDAKFEVINLITNAIDNSGLKIIATSEFNNYVKYIQPNKALTSLFQVVKLEEPGSNISLQILIDEVKRLEGKYKVTINIGALKRIIEFANKFDFDRVMPEKGIDLLEEACVTARNSNLHFVDINLIDQIISHKVGVQVGNIGDAEVEVLKNLEESMHQRIVGQDEAITAISSAIKRSRSGLASHKRPIASFLFYGPTGVGKTEVAKTLAQVYYGNEKLMLRLDMSEYQEEQNLNRLIGFNDEKGNFVGGFLTEPIRSKPFSLILLDEVEKANMKVLDLFLQVLDDGFLTDGMGRKVDFTNTIIIMTSNVGSKKISDLILKGYKYYDVAKEALSDLREYFRVEFLNRFDKLIMFKPLQPFEMERIVDLMLKEVKEKLMYKGIDFTWNEKTLNVLSQDGYDPNFGARELRRIIQEKIEDKIADLIVDRKLSSGMEVFFDGVEVGSVV